MYFVRWLMGHPIIAVWVLGAIAILLSMNPSTKGNHQSEEVTTISHKIKSGQIAKETDHINTETFEATEVTNNNHEAASAPEEDLAPVKTEGSDTNTVNSVGQKITESDVDKSESANAIGTIASTVENSQNTISTAVKQVKENLVEQPKIIVQKIKEAQIPSSLNAKLQGINNQTVSNNSTNLTQTNSTAEILLMAREAYWNNGFDEAAELYLQLIKQNPNEIEYKGELGNVYWRQGYSKKAAELYSEIALPMIENGHSDRVANMIGFISLFYPDRATTIHQRIISQKK